MNKTKKELTVKKKMETLDIGPKFHKKKAFAISIKQKKLLYFLAVLKSKQFYLVQFLICNENCAYMYIYIFVKPSILMEKKLLVKLNF